MDNPTYLSFDTGITDDRIYAHRGDIFICSGLFKEIDTLDKDDHILGKPSRPVIIISEDEYNRDIVKVLAFSSKEGSGYSDSINAYRSIRVPGVNNNPNPSFIDVSQVFTINTHQLKIKLGHASQEIVDAAVALHTLQNMNQNSVGTMMKVMKDRFPNAQAFRQANTVITKTNTVNCISSPLTDVFTNVQRVSKEELLCEVKSTLKEPNTKDDAYILYQEWLNLGTDVFRNKYGLTKQQYYSLRDKCVNKMLGKISNFKKYDWST
jgi:mRNA-degrading endonuclease toxin of MazEF toxin-antitoxin module